MCVYVCVYVYIYNIHMFNHSVMSDSVTPWTVVCWAPLSMGILQARILGWVAMPTSYIYIYIHTHIYIVKILLYVDKEILLQVDST